jgi:hypothetical protein
MSNRTHVRNFTPEDVDKQILEVLYPKEGGFSTTWSVPMLSEHSMVGSKYGQRSPVVFREQKHDIVYKMLLSTYVATEGNFFFPTLFSNNYLGDKGRTVVEFGANVGILAKICPEFGISYLGSEPSEELYAVAQREVFLNTLESLAVSDRNMVEWLEGILVFFAPADAPACAIFFFC